jgi:UPF0716 protein FxsA
VGKLFLLFTLVPLVELYLLLFMAARVGFWPTVGLVLVTGLLGAMLARREGLRVLGTWKQTLARGQMPAEGLLGAVLVLVGGVLLVTPGILTDLVGFLLLIPPTRRIIAVRVRRRLERSIRAGTVRVSSSGFGGGWGRGPGGPSPASAPDEDAWARVEDKTSDSRDEVVDAEVVEEPPRRPG